MHKTYYFKSAFGGYLVSTPDLELRRYKSLIGLFLDHPKAEFIK